MCVINYPSMFRMLSNARDDPKERFIRHLFRLLGRCSAQRFVLLVSRGLLRISVSQSSLKLLARVPSRSK